jgi:hypothetical protein
MCHCYTSISLDREEPSRSHALPADIVARYDELAERSWIHTSRGGALRLYTRSTSQKPRNQNNIVHLTKIRKNECTRHASIISLLDLIRAWDLHNHNRKSSCYSKNQHCGDLTHYGWSHLIVDIWIPFSNKVIL